MEIVILSNEHEVARHAADLVEPHVHQGNTLGLATGSTPLLTYRELIHRYQQKGLSFAECSAFLLDEYVGLPVGHEQSYRETIRREFTRHIDLDDHRTYGPNGSSQNLNAAAKNYERKLAESGGVDLQILGVGANGHIGFNEPGSSLVSRTRVKTLHPETVRDNARFFGSQEAVPPHVLTQGLGTIVDAAHLVLLATGESKANAVAALVEGPLAAVCPASVLQWHPNATVICDEAAALHLEHQEYYRAAAATKPRNVQKR